MKTGRADFAKYLRVVMPETVALAEALHKQSPDPAVGIQKLRKFRCQVYDAQLAQHENGHAKGA